MGRAPLVRVVQLGTVALLGTVRAQWGMVLGME
jgi:hypothetical protein